MEFYGSIDSVSGSITASLFTGSFKGDGGGLYNLPASGVTGLNLSQIASGNATASISSTGFTVNKSTQIQGDLSVTGSIVATNYIVSSSVTYMTTSFASGSSMFGNDNNDVHQFTGSVAIAGTLSLNGIAVGVGKLDETTFQSYTSSISSSIGSLSASIALTDVSQSNRLTTIEGNYATTGSNLFKGSQTISGSIIPSVDNTYDLGSPTYQWRDVYISSGSLYIDGTKVLGSTSQELTITTDTGQSIKILEAGTDSIILQSADGDIELKSSGGGDILFDPTSGLISIKGTTQIQDGFKITSSGGNSIVFGDSVIVSGSIELTGNIDGIDLQSFSSSVSASISSLLGGNTSLSSSIATTTSGLSSSIGSLSSSVATTTSGLTSTITSVSSSLTSSIGSLSSSLATTTSGLSSSIGSLSSSVASTTLNTKNRVDSIETTTGSLNTFSSSINTTIKSKLDSESVITGSIQILITGTTGYSTFSSSISTSIGALSSSVATTTSGLSSSIAITTSDLSSSIGSLSSSIAITTSGLSSSVATTTNGLSSSVATTTSELSSSIATTTLGIKNRVDSIENKTGSYATTGSNIFQGDQTITGSLYVSQNLIIAGSSSIQNISSSVVNIADNIITVNALNPSVRFGGLAVIDSGSSPQVSGSILFDSVNNQWLFVHQNQASVTSSVLLMGPETYNNLGNESYITSNRLVKSTGIEHLTNSNINDDGTTVTILSNAVVNGTFSATGTTLVSGSSQITYGSISGIPSGIVSGSSQVSYTGLSNIPSGIVSGSSQISFTGLSNIPGGIVSGSVQIDLTSTTNYSSGILTRLNAVGVVSGSAQIDLTATTNYSSGILTRLNAVGVFSGSAQVTGIGNAQLTNSSFNIGTTSISLGRASASQTLTGVSIDGNAATASSVNFANIAAGTRNNYTLDFKPPTSSYAGFRFSKSTSTDGQGDAGYLLIRGTDDNDIYTAEGITLVADLGWLTLAQRTTASKGIRLMTGSPSSSTRLQILTDGTIKLSSLTSNGFVKTSGSDGTLSIDTTTYLTSYTETSTLANVTSRGATTSTAIVSSNNIQATQFRSYLDGSNTISSGGMYIANAANNRAFNTQLNAAGDSLITFGYGGSAWSSVIQTLTNGGSMTLAGGLTFSTQGSKITFGDSTSGSPSMIGEGLVDTSGTDSDFLTIYARSSLRIFTTATNERARFDTNGMNINGTILPGANNSYNLGSATYGWANVYTNDLHLSNMNKPEGNDIDGTSGTWTIQEGEENLYIINNRNNKKYKIDLTEIL